VPLLLCQRHNATRRLPYKSYVAHGAIWVWDPWTTSYRCYVPNCLLVP